MGRNAAPFLAKGAGSNGLGGCPDLRHYADYSGGTVADSHGLPRFPCLNIVGRKSMSHSARCQLEALRERLYPYGILFVGFFRPMDIIDPPAARVANQCESCAVLPFIGAANMNLQRYARASLGQRAGA